MDCMEDMKRNVFDVLKERGYLAQVTLGDRFVSCWAGSPHLYIGFDPTADSLHVGHLFR